MMNKLSKLKKISEAGTSGRLKHWPEDDEHKTKSSLQSDCGYATGPEFFITEEANVDETNEGSVILKDADLKKIESQWNNFDALLKVADASLAMVRLWEVINSPDTQAYFNPKYITDIKDALEELEAVE